MRKKYIPIIFILCLFISACHKDNESPGNTDSYNPTNGTLSLNNQFGVVEFNDQLQRWVINFGNDLMTISPFTLNCTAVPLTDLPDQYKKPGTELLVAGTIEYSIDSISVVTKRPVVRYSLSVYNLTPAPSFTTLWSDYDYIRIKLPDRVLFFSANQLNMEACGSYTVVNLPDIKVYGMGGGFYYRQQESLTVSIFDSINRIQKNLPDVVKPGNLQYAIDAKSPGVSFNWSFPNVRYYSTLEGENNRPDCYFKIVRSEFIPGRLNRTYRIGATFRCVLKARVNGVDSRIMGEGQLVTKIDF